MDKETKLCFTIEPVDKCPRGCVREGFERVSVDMTCKSKTDPAATRLRLAVLKGETPDLKDQPISIKRIYTQVKSCRAP